MTKVHILAESPNDPWTEVELWRWQYGELPQSTDMRPLDIGKGLIGMADAIEAGCKAGNAELMPSPSNICSVLRYVASQTA